MRTASGWLWVETTRCLYSWLKKVSQCSLTCTQHCFFTNRLYLGALMTQSVAQPKPITDQINEPSCGGFDSVPCVVDGAAMRAGVQTGDRIIKVSPCFVAVVAQRLKVTDSTSLPACWNGLDEALRDKRLPHFHTLRNNDGKISLPLSLTSRLMGPWWRIQTT